MKEMAQLLDSSSSSREERLKAKREFLAKRGEIWKRIQEGKFPASYISSGRRKFVGAPRRTAIRCDFLVASKIALGAKYGRDPIADQAQRDLLFHVLRYREVFPGRKGKKFYCCPKCTTKLYECVSANVFRYVDNAKWKTEIDGADA